MHTMYMFFCLTKSRPKHGIRHKKKKHKKRHSSKRRRSQSSKRERNDLTKKRPSLSHSRSQSSVHRSSYHNRHMQRDRSHTPRDWNWRFKSHRMVEMSNVPRNSNTVNTTTASVVNRNNRSNTVSPTLPSMTSSQTHQSHTQNSVLNGVIRPTAHSLVFTPKLKPIRSRKPSTRFRWTK